MDIAKPTFNQFLTYGIAAAQFALFLYPEAVNNRHNAPRKGPLHQ